MLCSYLAVFGAILEAYGHFCKPSPKKVVFFKDWNFSFFKFFCLKMDLVALPGKNNRISDVSDPNWARFGKKRPILELRGDFPGCSCKSGRDNLKLKVLAKIKFFTLIHEVWAQKLKSFLLQTHSNAWFSISSVI